MASSLRSSRSKTKLGPSTPLATSLEPYVKILDASDPEVVIVQWEDALISSIPRSHVHEHMLKQYYDELAEIKRQRRQSLPTVESRTRTKSKKVTINEDTEDIQSLSALSIYELKDRNRFYAATKILVNDQGTKPFTKKNTVDHKSSTPAIYCGPCNIFVTEPCLLEDWTVAKIQERSSKDISFVYPHQQQVKGRHELAAGLNKGQWLNERVRRTTLGSGCQNPKGWTPDTDDNKIASLGAFGDGTSKRVVIDGFCYSKGYLMSVWEWNSEKGRLKSVEEYSNEVKVFQKEQAEIATYNQEYGSQKKGRGKGKGKQPDRPIQTLSEPHRPFLYARESVINRTDSSEKVRDRNKGGIQRFYLLEQDRDRNTLPTRIRITEASVRRLLSAKASQYFTLNLEEEGREMGLPASEGGEMSSESGPIDLYSVDDDQYQLFY